VTYTPDFEKMRRKMCWIGKDSSKDNFPIPNQLPEEDAGETGEIKPNPKPNVKPNIKPSKKLLETDRIPSVKFGLEKSKRYQVYSIHHFNEDLATKCTTYFNDVVTPIQSDAVLGDKLQYFDSNFGKMLYENEGENIYDALDAKTQDEKILIAELFSEFTATYWVWINVGLNKDNPVEYIGICHGTKLLNLGCMIPTQANEDYLKIPMLENLFPVFLSTGDSDLIPSFEDRAKLYSSKLFNPENFCGSHGMTSKNIAQLLDNQSKVSSTFIGEDCPYDVIIGDPKDLGEKITIDKKPDGTYNLESQYEQMHPEWGWFIEGVNAFCNEQQQHLDQNQRQFYKKFAEESNEYASKENPPLYFKCQILAKKAYFNQYCELLFGILFKIYNLHKKDLTFDFYTKGYNRLLAYMGERVYAMYCNYLVKEKSSVVGKFPVSCYHADYDPPVDPFSYFSLLDKHSDDHIGQYYKNTIQDKFTYGRYPHFWDDFTSSFNNIIADRAESIFLIKKDFGQTLGTNFIQALESDESGFRKIYLQPWLSLNKSYLNLVETTYGDETLVIYYFDKCERFIPGDIWYANDTKILCSVDNEDIKLQYVYIEKNEQFAVSRLVKGEWETLLRDTIKIVDWGGDLITVRPISWNQSMAINK
jgi:hypothetical protein